MCGIAGIVGGGSERELRAMAQVQKHRGPDDEGVLWFAEHRAGLAHRRLAIIDLTAEAHQPMSDASGRYWITYNGELYNYRELRDQLSAVGANFRTQSDTEVILHAFIHWGDKCPQRFRGMFAFGIYDSLTRELYIARDHMGVKPLYYVHHGNTFAFASEAKALFAVDGIAKIVDDDAVLSALWLMWVPEPITGFQNVKKLPPGHYGTLHDNQFTTTEYWAIPHDDLSSFPKRSESDYIDELRSLLEQAVRRSMVSDVPVGVCLSGGLDSSLIVALMRKVSNATLHTYSIGLSAKDFRAEAMPDDQKFARVVAKKFETKHCEVILEESDAKYVPTILGNMDDPVLDGAAVNTYMLASAAADNGLKVLLNGAGADELFGGYRLYRAVLLAEKYRRLPASMRARMIAPVVRRLPVSVGKRGVRTTRFAQRFIGIAEHTALDAFIIGSGQYDPSAFHELLSARFRDGNFNDSYATGRFYEEAQRYEKMSLVQRMTYVDARLIIPGLNAYYPDRAGMAASVECRLPYLDVELVEFAARLPDTMKVHGGALKYLLKRAAEAYLPKEIIYRPKAAFGLPIRSWMQGGLANEVRTTFTSSNDPILKFVDRGLPQRMVSEHQSGSADHAHRLWGLYAMNIWLSS